MYFCHHSFITSETRNFQLRIQRNNPHRYKIKMFLYLEQSESLRNHIDSNFERHLESYIRLLQMNTSNSYQKKFTKKQEKKVIIITYDQFQELLKTLSTPQAQELRMLVKDHALIQHDYVRKFFQGTDRIMEEIEYLLNIKSEESFLSLQSSFTQNDQTYNQTTIKKQILLSYSININQKNYRSAMKDLISITALPHNVFEVTCEQKEVVFANRQQQSRESKIIVTNRCLDNQQIYLVYQSEDQVLSLLTLLDAELKLNEIQEIVEQMQNRKENVFKVDLDEKQLYFFNKNINADWYKLISCINKTVKNEIVLLMKYRLFQDFNKQRSYFFKPIRVVMDEAEIHLKLDKIGQYRVLENNMQSIHRIKNLVIQLLTRGHNNYLKHNSIYLDQISSFNFHLLQQRKTKEMFVVKPSSKMTKSYVYFIFYKKLMLIQSILDTKSVQLKQKNFNEEITDKYYVLALQNMKKHAVINQIPFILIYDEAENVQKIDLEKIVWEKQTQLGHLLAYNYILTSPKYKISADTVFLTLYLSNKYEKPMKLTFNRASHLYGVLGQCRSEQIIQKKKIVENNVQKGCMLAHGQYCKQFLKERLEQQYKKA